MKLSSDKLQININRGLRNWTWNAFRFYYQRSFGNFFTRRDPKLWVFSSWEGTKYADNARYMFEYIIAHNDKGIRCVWLTKKEDVLKEVRKLGYEGYLIGTKNAKNIQKQAGVALCTHGLDDFGEYPYIFGAYTVNLCHGVGGAKRTYYSIRKANKLKKVVSVIKAKIFNYTYRDVTIVTSSFGVEVAKLDVLTKKNIPIIGLARNDYITAPIYDLTEVFSEEYICQHNLKIGLKYITFMPTYRPYKASQKKLEDSIRMIASDEKLRDVLEENNGRLIIKLHYATDPFNIKCSNNVLLLQDSDVKEVSKLLRLSDLLITDYSSCAMDFALKQKDIIFYAPDLEEYEKETGMYQEFLDYLYKYRVTSEDDLRERIRIDFEHDFAATESTVEINKLFNERASEVGEFRKLIYEYICSKINL